MDAPAAAERMLRTQTLSMELVMDRSGAIQAIYEFSAGMGKCFKMTEAEVHTMIAVLSRMDDDAQEGRLAAMREIRRLETGRRS